MHKKYAKDGVVCVSVSVDTPSDKARALKFLQKQQAGFTNFWLDEPNEVWQNYWDFGGPPAVFVFDQQGKKYSPDPTADVYVHVEKLVVKLLKAG
jgi:hypothetical protein